MTTDSSRIDRARARVAPILKTAVPIAIGQLGQMVMILVDMYVVGRIGSAAISGVGLGNAFFYVFGMFCAGTLFGLDYFISHAMGRKDLADCHRWLWQGVWLSLGLSITLSTVIALTCPSYIQSHFPPEVALPGVQFIQTLNLCLPSFLVFITFRQYLQATGSVNAGTVVTMMAIVLNAGLNWLFVLGSCGAPRWGVSGAGFATTATRTAMAISLILYTFYRDRKLSQGLAASSRRFEPGSLWKLLKLGAPIGFMLSLESGVFSLATAAISRYGVVSAASHTIALNIASFTYMIPMALSGAAAILVGQALGRGERREAREMGWTCMAVTTVIMTCTGLTLALAGHHVIGLFTKDEAVIALASRVIMLVALFQVADGAQSVGGGALRGLGSTRAAMGANIVGYWLIGLPLAWQFGERMQMGVMGFWIGLTIGLYAVATVVIIRWVRIDVNTLENPGEVSTFHV